MIPAELVRRDKRTLRAVSNLAAVTAAKALPDLSTLTPAGAGGVFRRIATGTLASFGNVATSAASTSYADMRAAALPLERALTFSAPFVLAPEAVEPLVGYGMSKYSEGLFAEASNAFVAGVGRTVANNYRVAGATLSDRDKKADGFQRVASPNACAFCLVVALNKYTSFSDSGGYHDHCSCSTVPVFRGVEAYHPDYYDEFQSVYAQGRADALNPSNASDIFAAIRAATGRN